jgi:hypothetical protein
LTRNAVGLALGGDPTALRLCIDRLIVPHRERLVPFALPPMRKPADLAPAMEAIAAAVARGVLAPAEAAELAKVVDTFANAIEVRDFDSRLRVLEDAAAER